MSEAKGPEDRGAERGAAPARREAARTTIVGGQPPGNAREVPPIPVGLEHLLGLAAASPEFAEALRRDPRAAVQATGLALSASERAILSAVPAPALDQMVSQMNGRLAEPERRRFLEHAALAVAALVGGSALAACGDKKGASEGKKSAPSPEPRPRGDDYTGADMGIRPGDRFSDMDEMSAEMGTPDPVRPAPGDEPAMEAAPPPMATPPPDAGAPRPRPMRPPLTKGIRPRSVDGPQYRTRGHSSSRGGGSAGESL